MFNASTDSEMKYGAPICISGLIRSSASVQLYRHVVAGKTLLPKLSAFPACRALLDLTG